MFLELFRHEVANTAQLLVSESISGVMFKHHLATFKHRAFGNQHYRVLAGILGTVFNQKLRQSFDIEFMFRNHTTVCCARHGRQHGSEPCVASENFEYEKTFM